MTGPDAPPFIRRFSSRLARLSHVFLADRLRNAREYRRIAGYFRSSIFELVGEEIEGVNRVQIVCNSELDPRDLRASRLAREMALKEKWNDGADPIDSSAESPALPEAVRAAQERQGRGSRRLGQRRAVPARQGRCDRPAGWNVVGLPRQP